MAFSSLVGNERIKRLLKRAVLQGRIGQGLIMAGPRGVGKHQFAIALAQAVNCLNPVEGDGCDECIPCRRIARSEHADVRTIVPEKQVIKIDQMREMSREAQFRPYEGRRRVYIIDDAHCLRQEAANSILKTLEEPPDTSLIALITSKPYALLETIRSRCQMLSFAPLTAVELESHLAANFRRPREETRLLARFARGSIGRAMEIDLGEYREKRSAMMEVIEALALTRDTVLLLDKAEYMGRKLDRAEFENHIDILMVLLEDIFHLKLGNPAESLTNADIIERLSAAAEAVTLDQIMNWVEGIQELFEKMTRNINRHIAMEALLLQG